MLGRFVFASIGLAVFLTALLSGLLGGYALLMIGLVATATTTVILLMPVPSRGVLAQIIRPFLRPFLRTNNHWLLCMLVMTVLAFWLAITTDLGYPVIRTVVQEEVAKGNSTRLDEINQRYENLYRYGELKTDAELELSKLTPEQPKSWTPWWIRWISALLLLILTIGYIPFAFADEVQAAYHRAERGFAERAGGETGGRSLLRDLIRRVARIPENPQPTVTSQPPPPPAGGTTPPTTPPAAIPPPTPQVIPAAVHTGVHGEGWWKLFLTALLAEVVGEVGERFFPRRI